MRWGALLVPVLSAATASALVVAAVGFAPGCSAHAGQRPAPTVPRKVKHVPPIYPAASLAAGDEGAVIVELQVDAFGTIQDARVVWSTCEALDEAALKTVKRWRYESVATPFVVTTTLAFRLPKAVAHRAGNQGACVWVDPPEPLR